MDQTSYLKVINAALITAIFTGLLVIIAVFVYTYEVRQTKEGNRDKMETLTSIKQAELMDWFEDEIRDANLITDDPNFIQLIEGGYEETFAPSILLEKLNQIKLEHFYADLILLDTLGNPTVSTNPALVFNDSIDKAFYEKAKLSDSCLISELFRSSIDDRVYIDIIAAIKSDEGMDLGGMVFKIGLERTLDRLMVDWHHEAIRGKLSFLWERSKGQWLVYRPGYSNPQSTSCWLPLMPEQRAEGLGEQLLQGQRPPKDALYTLNYLPQVPWLLLVELDDKPGRETLKALSNFLIILVVILAMLGFLAVYMLIHYKQGKHINSLINRNTELDAFKRQYQLTLDVLHEAVLVTDSLGRITTHNLMAESLLGLKYDELSGKDVDEVLRLTRPGTGVPLFNVQSWLHGDKAMSSYQDASLHTVMGDVLSVSCTLTYLPSTKPHQDGLVLAIKQETAITDQHRFSH
ncbi:MAG: PAS domain-containing protein [Bacteroidales bacterium]|jgi:PAS domain-containing protein|nr:PAS domain-containing protein [Bacteroidales bacterium]